MPNAPKRFSEQTDLSNTNDINEEQPKRQKTISSTTNNEPAEAEENGLSSKDLLLQKIRDNDPETSRVELSCEEEGSFLSFAIKALEKNTMVKEIDLHMSSLSIEDMENLSNVIRLNKVTYLDLNLTSLNEEKINILAGALKDNNSLNHLDLGFNRMQIKTLKTLMDSISNNHNLNSLSLYGNEVGDEGIKTVSDFLHTNASITHLDLTGNNISALGAKVIAENIINKKLVELNLGCNNITDSGATYLFKTLTGNKYIKSLILDSINISYKSMEAIRDFLTSTPVENLSLAGNNIGGGIQDLAFALKVNTALKTLNLNDTRLNHEDIGKLAEVLTENNTLETLRLSNNEEIGNLGVEAIANMLLKNNSLKNISLVDVNLGDVGAIYLSAVLQKKIEQSQQNLNKLDLTDNNITDLGGEKLKSVSEHVDLIVAGNEISNLMFEKNVELIGESY